MLLGEEHLPFCTLKALEIPPQHQTSAPIYTACVASLMPRLYWRKAFQRADQKFPNETWNLITLPFWRFAKIPTSTFRMFIFYRTFKRSWSWIKSCKTPHHLSGFQLNQVHNDFTVCSMFSWSAFWDTPLLASCSQLNRNLKISNSKECMPQQANMQTCSLSLKTSIPLGKRFEILHTFIQITCPDPHPFPTHQTHQTLPPESCPSPATSTFCSSNLPPW